MQKPEFISSLFDWHKLFALSMVNYVQYSWKSCEAQRGHGRSRSPGVWIGCTLPSIRKSRTAACGRPEPEIFVGARLRL